jgi:hypothetical protein
MLASMQEGVTMKTYDGHAVAIGCEALRKLVVVLAFMSAGIAGSKNIPL